MSINTQLSEKYTRMHDTRCISARMVINSLWPNVDMVTYIWVNIGSGNGLLPDGTKPLPEPMLTHHQ